MKPIVNPLTVQRMSLGLGYLVIMMGKLEVLSSRVNVNTSRDNTRAHNRALNVPARSADTPRGIVLRLIFLGFLPKSKVLSISLLIDKIVVFLVLLLDLSLSLNDLLLDL